MTRRLSPGLSASALWLTGLGLVGSGAAVAQPGGARSSAPSASARPLQETALPGPKPGFAPDPPTRASKKHWVFELSVKKGVLDIDKVTSRTLADALATPRKMGRFALELWVGKELLDRVRFDLPLLGDIKPEGRGPLFRPVSFDKVTTKLTVQMADAPRAVWGMLLDRAADDATYALAGSKLPRSFSWPPDEQGKLAPRPTLASAGSASAWTAASSAAPSAVGSASSGPLAAPAASSAPSPRASGPASPSPSPSGSAPRR